MKELRESRLAELRREIAIGIDQADRGEVAPLDMEDIKLCARRCLAEKKEEEKRG